MTPDTAGNVSPDAAIAALAWASDFAERGQPRGPLPGRAPTLGELRAVPVGVLRSRLDALLVGKNPEPALDAMQELGVFAAWIPEVDGLVGFGDGEWRHKDVWKHTKQVVRQSVPRLEVRWGALLHDIGKPRTRSIEGDGTVHFFGHSEVGAAMFRKRVAERLGFEGALYERIHYLILYHLRASQYEADWTDSAVRRFAKEMGDGLQDLLDLSRADITTKRPERRQRGLRQISELSRRIREIRKLDERVPPLPKGLGNLLMEAFSLPPSKRIGEIRDALEHAVESGELEPGKDAAHYVDWIRAHKERFGL